MIVSEHLGGERIHHVYPTDIIVVLFGTVGIVGVLSACKESSCAFLRKITRSDGFVSFVDRIQDVSGGIPVDLQEVFHRSMFSESSFPMIKNSIGHDLLLSFRWVMSNFRHTAFRSLLSCSLS